MLPRPLLALLVLGALSAPAASQVVNPADKQRPPDDPGAVLPSDVATVQVGSTTVTAQRMSELREEDLIGSYRQPEWTAHRRFPTTRVYVRPANTFGFEYWSRPTIPEKGPTETRTQYEFEIGLPNRFQLDFYIVNNSEGHDGSSEFDQHKTELRYALADWGEIPWNPTLYAEYVNNNNEADAYELKLLFGDELATSWHWGTNLVFEHQLGDSLENVYEVTAGISKTLRDQRLSLGVEVKAAMADEHDDRGEYEEELFIGPSLQYRPSNRVHIDLAPLVGVGSDSPDAQLFLVIGYDI